MSTLPNPVGRPPKTWRLPSVSVVVTTLQREACMLRVISKMFVGKGPRCQELRDSLTAKSHELDRFAGSLQELP